MKQDYGAYLTMGMDQLRAMVKEQIEKIKSLGGVDILVYHMVPAFHGMGWVFTRHDGNVPIHKLRVPTLLVMNPDVVYITGVSCHLEGVPGERFYAFSGCTRQDMSGCSKPKGRLKAIGLVIATYRLRWEMEDYFNQTKH